MWVLSGILDVSVVFLGVDEAFGFFYSVPIRLAVRSMILLLLVLQWCGMN